MPQRDVHKADHARHRVPSVGGGVPLHLEHRPQRRDPRALLQRRRRCVSASASPSLNRQTALGAHVEHTYLCSRLLLMTDLFVDVGKNYSIIDTPQLAFMFEYVGSKEVHQLTTSDQYVRTPL